MDLIYPKKQKVEPAIQKEVLPASRVGYWASHDFEKRSSFSVKYFCGWNILLSLINKCSTWIERGLIGALFETGGRASEILSLTTDQFVDQGRYVEVLGMVVLKQTDEQFKFRNVPMLKSEPLLAPLMEWVNDVRERGGGRLFPYKYDWLYKHVVDIDPDWWPHRFRAERASQLVREKKFTILDLMKFFMWKKETMATHYARLGVEDLVEKMSRGQL